MLLIDQFDLLKLYYCFFFVRVSVELFLFMANLALSLKRDFSRTSEEYPGSKGGLFTLTGTWKTLRLVCVCVCVCMCIYTYTYICIYTYIQIVHFTIPSCVLPSLVGVSLLNCTADCFAIILTKTHVSEVLSLLFLSSTLIHQF